MQKSLILPALVLSIALTSIACDTSQINRLQRDLTNLLEDPLDTQPYPILIGGDDANVFYATNLADIPFKLDGQKNSYVIPGLLGPSNVYEFESNQPELIRPLAPPATGFYQRMVTDGRFVAYVDVGYTDEQLTFDSVTVDDLYEGFVLGSPQKVVDVGDNESQFVFPNLRIDSGRLAVILANIDTDLTSVRIVSLLDDTADIEFEVGSSLFSSDLRGERFAYIAQIDGHSVVVVRNLATGEMIEIPDGTLTSTVFVSDIYLTSNGLVWSEDASPELNRVARYDFTTGTTRVISEGVRGRLAGATDEFLLTEEFVDRSAENKANLVRIRRIDMDGKMKELAEFKANGLAGQARVIGNRAAWVNAQRRGVIAPFDNRDRNAFKPF